MKAIKESLNAHHWPRNKVPSIECRKRDLIIRIADWTRESPLTGDPAFHVETYVGGIYDWTLSQCFCLRGKTKVQARAEAVAFAQKQIASLL